MKILFLYGSNSRNSGGLYNSVRNLALSLIKIKNIEPVLLAHNDEYSSVDLPAYNPVIIEDYKILGPSKIGFSIDLSKKIKQISPDIIHTQCVWMYLSFVNLNYHKKNNVPYLISPRGMLDPWIIGRGVWKKFLAKIFYEKKNLQNASCIHALSLSEYESIRKFRCKNPVAIIPNGVALPSEDPLSNIDPPGWRSDDERKILFFISRLHPKKGLENLLNAWSQIGAQRKEWKLVIAGESSEKNYLNSLHDLRIKLELEKEVFFIGPQFHQEKDICFRNVNAFILPSFSEGLPMAVLEAWSYKLPVIMTGACNLPEGFERGAALKINPDTTNILSVLNVFFNLTENERIQMGKAGYELVKEKFSWPSVAEQLREVYNWVLNKGKAPASIKFD